MTFLLQTIIPLIEAGVYLTMALAGVAGAVFAFITFDTHLLTRPFKWPCVIACVCVSAYSIGFIMGRDDTTQQLREAQRQIEVLKEQVETTQRILDAANKRANERQELNEILTEVIANYETELENGETNSCAADPAYSRRLQSILNRITTTTGPAK